MVFGVVLFARNVASSGVGMQAPSRLENLGVDVCWAWGLCIGFGYRSYRDGGGGIIFDIYGSRDISRTVAL